MVKTFMFGEARSEAPSAPATKLAHERFARAFTTWHAYPVAIPEMPNSFEIVESLEPHGVRLKLSGELDVAVINRLRDRIESVARAGETVVVDLAELDFIDSSGLNVLVTAFKQSKRDGWNLRIEPTMSRPVRRVVTLMGLDAVFWAEQEPLGS